MTLLKRIASSNFFIKLTHWEYWPFGIVQFPAIIYYFWLSLRSRSFFFFTASNPGIPMGGMFGESKYDILKKVPDHLKPETIRIDIPVSSEGVLKTLSENGFQFPVIFKPDLGERGFMVKKISSEKDVQDYLDKIRIHFLVQELVDYPMEFGVFFSKLPSQKKGKVVSVVMKEMLFVVGDGKSTLLELILSKDRAKLQWQKLQHAFRERLSEILPAGERLELVSIGNHALGTKFLNGNYLINEKLNSAFDSIANQIEGFYFGRFDLRCKSLEDLYEGKVKIVELNGCGAEPAHIYDPDFKLTMGMIVLVKHWRSIFEIARENHKLGAQFETFERAREYYREFKRATQ